MIKSELLSDLKVNHGFFGTDLTENKHNVFDSEQKISDFSKKIGVNHTIFLNQIHSNKISTLRSQKKSDGIIINTKNTAIALKTADCVPILLYDNETKTIGAIHAGARGVARGVVEAGLKEFLKFKPKNIYIVLGPAIAKESYEIQHDFARFFPKNCIENINEKLYLDLKKVIKEKIKTYLGDIMIKKMEDISINTYTNTLFHSYRREVRTHLRNISYIAL